MTTQDVERDESTPRPVEGFKALGFFTADHASVEGGKVYANGAYFQTLNFPAFPATLPSASVVAVIQIPWHANNHDHKFEVLLLDSDGKAHPNFVIEGNFRGSPGPEMKYGEPGIMPVAIPLFGLQFERPGEYSFILKVDGTELARYAIIVRQVAFAGGMVLPTPPAPPRPTEF
jgi:hypothetical protein